MAIDSTPPTTDFEPPIIDPKLRIIAYLNPLCPWTHGVVAFFKGQQLTFDYRDIMQEPSQYEEMVKKSGQHSSPCVEIDGHMLADVGGDEIEAWMRQQGYLRN